MLKIADLNFSFIKYTRNYIDYKINVSTAIFCGVNQRLSIGRDSEQPL